MLYLIKYYEYLSVVNKYFIIGNILGEIFASRNMLITKKY